MDKTALRGFLVVPIIFVMAGLLLLADKFLYAFTVEEAKIESVQHFKKNSLYYSTVCAEQNNICIDISQDNSLKKGDKTYIYSTFDFSSIAYLILPSTKEHPFIIKTMDMGFSFNTIVSWFIMFVLLSPLIVFITVRIYYRNKETKFQ